MHGDEMTRRCYFGYTYTRVYIHIRYVSTDLVAALGDVSLVLQLWAALIPYFRNVTK
jgi:hypothetical protein